VIALFQEARGIEHRSLGANYDNLSVLRRKMFTLRAGRPVGSQIIQV
jgi:hypothetical protein